MKKILVLLLLLAACLLSAPASADDQYTHNGCTYEYVSTVNPEKLIYNVKLISVAAKDSETLTIPASFVLMDGPDRSTYNVVAVDSGALSGCLSLKYIRFDEHDASDLLKIQNGALNLSEAENLEAVYLNAISGDIKKKFTLPSDKSDQILLQYLSPSNMSTEFINNDPPVQNGSVQFSFNNVIPDGYAGYEYIVVRTEKGSDDVPDEFSGPTAPISISNGRATFTDNGPLSPGKTYTYDFIVCDPFGNSTKLASLPIEVPADPAPVPDDVLAAIDSLPDTGDRASLAPWLLLLGASALLLLGRKSRRFN